MNEYYLPLHEDPNLPPNTIRLESPDGSQAFFSGMAVSMTTGHELWANTVTCQAQSTSHVTWNVDAPPNTSMSIEAIAPSTVTMQTYSELAKMWMQERDENARLRAEITRLLAQGEATLKIVQEVAEEDPYTYNDNNGKMECAFCVDTWGWGAHEKHTKDHEPDCLIARARNFVQHKEQE